MSCAEGNEGVGNHRLEETTSGGSQTRKDETNSPGILLEPNGGEFVSLLGLRVVNEEGR